MLKDEVTPLETAWPSGELSELPFFFFLDLDELDEMMYHINTPL